MTKKSFLLVFITLAVLFIGITLSPVVAKNPKDISYSDFRLVIAPFLSTIGMLITYAQLKKDKN